MSITPNSVNPPSRASQWIWWLALLLIPLAIGLAWGDYLADAVYLTFRHARNLALGRGLAHGALSSDQFLLQSPLYVLVLALPARLGVPLPQVSMWLSAIGWGITAILLHRFCHSVQRPIAGVVAAGLLVFNPIVAQSLGSEAAWTAALAWLAVLLIWRKHWKAQVGALAALMWTHFDLGTLGIAAAGLAVQWVARRRFPWLGGLVLILAGVGWVALNPQPPAASLQSLISPFRAPFSHLAAWLSALPGENELYWFFLPAVSLGVWSIIRPLIKRRTRDSLWAGLVGGALVLVWGGAAAWALWVTLGLFLTGLGIDQAASWIETQGWLRVKHVVLFHSIKLPVAALAIFIAAAPLGMAQVSSLWQRYPLRPIARQQIERQAAGWLQANSEPGATVLSSEQIGYLADRPTLPWDGASDPAELMQTLNERPADYCVSFRSLSWQRLLQSGLFQDGYIPVQKFESPYDAASPFTIWRYRFDAFRLGERKPLNGHLPGQVEWVGYTYWPDRIQPGEAVYVTLFWQATQPVTIAQRTIVRVISPWDGKGWAQRDTVLPSSVPLEWWQPGQVIAERLVLTTTDDISMGAYQIDVAAVAPDMSSILPIYQNDNPSPLEWLNLGYVVVPWPQAAQQAALASAKPSGAKLGGQVSLLGFEAPDNLSAGDELELKLYWQALQPPRENYVVFVHLLDSNEQLVAGHDGPPLDGKYPTQAWIPGEIVPDVHRVAIGPETPPGVYRLQVGMYTWPSLERLPVWDSQGVEQADRVLVLQPVTVQ
ncbi:MAG: hypothetical protein JW850_11565 [Thermoflexales bacterium]|nr:hypothetical protein [Thermoflexales bacterium]